MLSKLKTINQIFFSISEILRINYFILRFKFLDRSRKVILIYHPSKLLTLNHKDYLRELFDNFDKKYLIINAHQINALKERKYFFFSHIFFLRFVFGVNLFFSTYVSDIFTPKSIKVYMHHDIYDTPLVNEKKLKQLHRRILKYDYLFLPNKQSIGMFENLFSRFNKDENKKNPKMFETGYYKLDFLNKKKELSKKYENNNIIIAPTNFLIWPEFCINNLEKIINTLINKKNYNIVYRPHPSNWKNPKVLNILEKFESYKNFKYDNSLDYFDIYINSICMITDLSGTAYTYSLFTKNPVIFYSYNENIIKNLKYDRLHYFKDRTKIGFISKDIEEVTNYISYIENNTSNKIGSINELEKSFFYLGKAKNRIKDLINDILTKY